MDDRQATEFGQLSEPAALPPEAPPAALPPEAPLPASLPGLEEPLPHDRPTRASGVWAAVVAGLLVLTVLLVFILQNTSSVRVTFFSAHWSGPLGVEMLIAAVIGGFVVVFAGVARILELRRRARAVSRRARAATKAAGGS